MTDLSHLITSELTREIRYRLHEEYLPRIHYCLDQLTDDQIWWRPNPQSNSIGNLILHLCGNLRQWILSGIADQSDIRKRKVEFAEQGPIPKTELKAMIQSTIDDILPVIGRVAPPDLLVRKRVQVYEESVMTILIHVTEHFSYHTGQIAWITKMLTNEDLGFYKDVDLG